MTYAKDPKLPRNSARRRFLGVAAAASARLASVAVLAAAASSLPAKAAGLHLGWGKGKGNSGEHGKSGRGGGSGGPLCFLHGTSILTDCGEKRIEDLRIGDRVVVRGGETGSIRWVGRQVFKKNGLRWQEDVVPVRVARHALDNRTPHSDLYLSPGHALFLNGVLIRVKDLINGTTIAPIAPRDDTTIAYYAILLATHEVIFAEGAAAETFNPSVSDRENFSNFAEFERLYAGEKPMAMRSYAPVLGEEGGWEHLKALLLLPFVPSHDPFEDACMTISARMKELSI